MNFYLKLEHVNSNRMEIKSGNEQRIISKRRACESIITDRFNEVVFIGCHYANVIGKLTLKIINSELSIKSRDSPTKMMA